MMLFEPLANPTGLRSMISVETDCSPDVLTELPFGLPGRVFRSPMPFGPFDPRQSVLDRYREETISTVVVLASDEECLRHSGRNLRDFYEAEGMHVIYAPTPDFGVPSQQVMEAAAGEALECARSGRSLAIHCLAGKGRTGLFTACLGKRALGLDGQRAIGWARQYIRGAIETQEQEQWVLDF